MHIFRGNVQICLLRRSKLQRNVQVIKGMPYITKARGNTSWYMGWVYNFDMCFRALDSKIVLQTRIRTSERFTGAKKSYLLVNILSCDHFAHLAHHMNYLSRAIEDLQYIQYGRLRVLDFFSFAVFEFLYYCFIAI